MQSVTTLLLMLFSTTIILSSYTWAVSGEESALNSCSYSAGENSANEEGDEEETGSADCV